MINHGLTDKTTKIFHSNSFKLKQIYISDIFLFFSHFNTFLTVNKFIIIFKIFHERIFGLNSIRKNCSCDSTCIIIKSGYIFHN